jgi:hypothetical protein
MKNDLISRKALLTVSNVRKVTEFDETGTGITYLAVPVEEIEKAPAIKAEPVRYGEWVDGNCSTCGLPIPTDDRQDAIFEEDVHFCYFCGTFMNGGKKDVPL